MVLEGLTIAVSGAAADATTALSAVRSRLSSVDRGAADASRAIGGTGRALDDLAGDSVAAAAALQGVASRADAAEGQIGAAGRSAAVTSGTFTALSLSTSGLSLSVGTLSTTLTASLIPALVALLTTVGPIVSTLGAATAAAGGLAAAFGAVVGTGLLAFGRDLAENNRRRLRQVRDQIRALERLEDQEGDLTAQQQRRLDQLREQEQTLDDQTTATGALAGRLKELKQELVAVAAQFGAQFVPLIRDAVAALPDLLRNTLDALGGLERFRDALRDFGSAAFDAIPQATSALVDLGRRALPIVRDFVGFLGGQAGSILDGFVRTAARLGDEFSGFVGAVLDAAPSINRFGTAVLELLVPALSGATRGFGDLLDRILAFVQSGDAQRTIAVLAAGFRELRPELERVAGLFLTISGDALKGLIDALPSFLTAVTAIIDVLLDGLITVLEFIRQVQRELEPLAAVADSIARGSGRLSVASQPQREAVGLSGNSVRRQRASTMSLAERFIRANAPEQRRRRRNPSEAPLDEFDISVAVDSSEEFDARVEEVAVRSANRTQRRTADRVRRGVGNQTEGSR